MLLDGAGAAQAWSDTKAKDKWPKGSGPWLVPRSWDRLEDRVSISLGAELYRRKPLHIAPSELVHAIVHTTGLLTKSASTLRSETRPQTGASHRCSQGTVH
jgi:hypothetical protein